MNTGDVFDEHLGVIAALRDNYARHDDTDTIRELLGIQEELEGLLSSREDTVKQAIQGVLSSRRERSDTGQYAGMDYLWKQGPASLLHCSLTALSSRVEEARIKAVYPEEEGAHDARLRELEARVAASKQHVAQLTTELEALGKQRQQLGSSMKEVGLKKAQVDHLLLEDEPRIRCDAPGSAQWQWNLWVTGRAGPFELRPGKCSGLVLPARCEGVLSPNYVITICTGISLACTPTYPRSAGGSTIPTALRARSRILKRRMCGSSTWPRRCPALRPPTSSGG